MIFRLQQFIVLLFILVLTSFSTLAQANSLPSFQGQHYVVSVSSEQLPIPMHQIHNWILNIKTRHGDNLANAKIKVYGGMPEHKHGLPTQPSAEEVGNGNYRIQGVKFSMGGEWELWFEITSPHGTEMAKFKLSL